MKKTKILSFASLPLAMALLAGCGHEHTFSDAWNHDENKHWHDATCEHKDQVKDEGPHVDGNNDGKCDVCDFEMPIYTVTKEEWNASFGLDKPYYLGDNYKGVIVTTADGYPAESETAIVDGTKVHFVATDEDGLFEQYAEKKAENSFEFYTKDPSGKWVIGYGSRNPLEYFAAQFSPCDFDKFTYDEASHTYKCEKANHYMYGEARNLSLGFKNKKIVSYSFEYTAPGQDINVKFDGTFSYGGQTVELPHVDPVDDSHKVDEAGWHKAFGAETYLFMFADNYKSSISITGDGPMLGDITLTAEDNKLKSEVGETLYYYSLEENVPYCYSKSGEKWAKTAMRSESDLTAAVSIYFEPLGDYSIFAYDEVSQSYKAESVMIYGQEYTNLVVSFTDGKVMSASYDMPNPSDPSQVGHFESSFVYGGQTVTLPDVPQGGVDLAKAKQVMGSFLNYFEKQDIEKAMPKRSEVRISDFLNKDLVPGTFDTVNYVGQALMYAKVAELFMNQIIDYDSSKILQGVISEGGMSMTFNLRFNVVTNGDDSELTVDISFTNPETGGLGGVHLVAQQVEGALANFELYSSAVGGGSVNEKRFYYDDLIFKQGESLKAGRFIVDQDTKEVVHEDGTFAQEIVNEGHNLFMANITPFVDYIRDNTDKITTVDNFMETFYQAAMYYQELINSYTPSPVPGEPVYAYKLNDADYIEMFFNQKNNQWEAYDIDMRAGETLTIANIGASLQEPAILTSLSIGGETQEFTILDGVLTAGKDGVYSFYLCPEYGSDLIYIADNTPVPSGFSYFVNSDEAAEMYLVEENHVLASSVDLNKGDTIKFADTKGEPIYLTSLSISGEAQGFDIVDGVLTANVTGLYDFDVYLSAGADSVVITPQVIPEPFSGAITAGGQPQGTGYFYFNKIDSVNKFVEYRILGAEIPDVPVTITLSITKDGSPVVVDELEQYGAYKDFELSDDGLTLTYVGTGANAYNFYLKDSYDGNHVGLYVEYVNPPTPATVKVTLSVKKDVGMGNGLYILGTMNDWDISRAIRGTWTEGNVWVFELEIPANTDVSYKLAIANYDDPTQGSTSWEADPDRHLNESKDVSYTLTWQD